MLYLKRDKKDEENGASGNPFHNLEKTTVLQEARVFNETPIIPRRCIHILTKFLYILNQGETFGKTEATEAFFATTKLFQSKDVTLRRMVYLLIKELSTSAEDVIIVTSSLTKDMTGKEDLYRAAAIRTLCRITDTTMLQGIERYMKQAIVDKVHSVSSAALVSSLHLMKTSHDVVKRWVNEAQEAVNSDNIMVQYHALGLLYHIKQNDRLAVTKLVSKFTRSSLRSPYAYCLLIRIACKLLSDENGGSDSPYFEFVESCLRHKSEMVIYEAAHAIVNMRGTTSRELAPAVSVLQLFCSSPKPTLRFAAVRTLNKVAMSHPAAITACNLDLENLITDVNRSVATLAITTLLKTGSEASVDRLMKQIAGFMSEISDEFKIVVVEAIRSLCCKFPKKHGIMMNFLTSMLRDEGGFEYKRAIVETIITIIDENHEAKESGLSHLCEFIEDCEHTVLSTRILHLLGREGPRTAHPAKYIRYVYNRVVLENAAVRAAAVSSLAKFGAHSEDMLPNVLVLLRRCLLDTDDEVRDRAIFYVNLLEQRERQLNCAYILTGLQVSVVGLEKALHHYTLDPRETPFDLKAVPLETQPLTAEPARAAATGSARAAGAAAGGVDVAAAAATRQDVFAEQLAAIPAFADLGTLFRSSSPPAELTESETEYVVRCVKHTFPAHVVFQFDCTNTLDDQTLSDARVHMEPADPAFEVVETVPCTRLRYNAPGATYTCVRLPEGGVAAATCTFACALRFTVRDCDPGTGEEEPEDEGYADEYVLEDAELTMADHVRRVARPDFAAAWDAAGDDNEREDTFALSSAATVADAVRDVVAFLGMQPCERSDRVADGRSAHTLYLAGVFRGGHEALARARLAVADGGVTMQLCVRSDDPEVSDLIVSAIG